MPELTHTLLLNYQEFAASLTGALREKVDKLVGFLNRYLNDEKFSEEELEAIETTIVEVKEMIPDAQSEIQATLTEMTNVSKEVVRKVRLRPADETGRRPDNVKSY
ncbi:MAG: hypothetical protein AAF135_22980 [Bacteroidota bacterium]